MTIFDPYKRIEELTARALAPIRRADEIRRRAEAFDEGGFAAAWEATIAPLFAENPDLEAEWIAALERALAALPERSGP